VSGFEEGDLSEWDTAVPVTVADAPVGVLPKALVVRPMPHPDAEDLGQDQGIFDASRLDKNFRALKTVDTMKEVITNDRRWIGTLAWSKLLHAPVWTGEPVCLRRESRPSTPGRAVNEDDVTAISYWFDRIYGKAFEEKAIYRAIQVTARAREFHPFLDFIRETPWDGVPRVDAFCSNYLNASHEASGYLSICSRVMLLGLISRCLNPGEKLDDMAILEGPQGYEKSSALATLVGNREWFADTRLDLKSKDSMQALRGRLIYEWGELDGMKGQEANRIKGFLSSSVDSYRPPYGKDFVEFPRVGIIVGTTNESRYLADPTGLRRFWPFKVTAKIDRHAIVADRAQIWAEALHRVEARERHYSTQEEATKWNDIKKARTHEDPWVGAIRSWLDAPTFGETGEEFKMETGVTLGDVMSHALRIPVERQQLYSAKAEAALEEVGWRRSEKRVSVSDRRRVWVPAADLEG